MKASQTIPAVRWLKLTAGADVQVQPDPRKRRRTSGPVVYYFAPSDLQVPRVDRQCIVRACEALGAIVERLTLIAVSIEVCPHETMAPATAEQMYDVYGVRRTFDIVLLPGTVRQDRRSRFDGLLIAAKYWRYLARELATYRADDVPIIYIKNYLYGAAFLAFRSLMRRPFRLVYELHMLPRRGYQRAVLKRCHGIITNSHALGRDLRRVPGFARKSILGIHQGVQLARIESLRLTRAAARERLGLPADQFMAVYTGKVYQGYREIDYYIEAARLLPWCQFLIVGGRADHVALLREQTSALPNIRFTGFVPPTEVCYYQFAADVLLLYYPGKLDARRSGSALNPYRSPGKLFEYMASGTPIVVADYPVLREVLPAGSATFVERDRPAALADAIAEVVVRPDRAHRVAIHARAAVEAFTWERRATTIAEFLRDLNHRRSYRRST